MNEHTPLNRDAPTAAGRASWSTVATPQRLRVVTVLALVVAMIIYIANVAPSPPASTLKLKPASTSQTTQPTSPQTLPDGVGGGSPVAMDEATTVDASSRKDHVTFVPGFGSPLEKQVRGFYSSELF